MKLRNPRMMQLERVALARVQLSKSLKLPEDHPNAAQNYKRNNLQRLCNRRKACPSSPVIVYAYTLD